MYLKLLWGLMFGDRIARMLKSKDVSLSMIRPRMTGA
jgi:hypothetical protein